MIVLLKPDLESITWSTGFVRRTRIHHLLIDNIHCIYTIDYINNITILKPTGETQLFDNFDYSIPKILELNMDNPKDTIEKFYSLLMMK